MPATIKRGGPENEGLRGDAGGRFNRDRPDRPPREGGAREGYRARDANPNA